MLGENLEGRACEQLAPRWIAMAGGRAAGASAVCAEMVDTAGMVEEKAAEAAKVVAQATEVAVTAPPVGTVAEATEVVDETTEVLVAARSRTCSGGRSRSNHHRARSFRTRRPDHRRRTRRPRGRSTCSRRVRLPRSCTLASPPRKEHLKSPKSM